MHTVALWNVTEASQNSSVPGLAYTNFILPPKLDYASVVAIAASSHLILTNGRYPNINLVFYSCLRGLSKVSRETQLISAKKHIFDLQVIHLFYKVWRYRNAFHSDCTVHGTVCSCVWAGFLYTIIADIMNIINMQAHVQAYTQRERERNNQLPLGKEK